MRTGTVQYLIGDHLGSTSLTLNNTGGLVAEIRYKAWGESRYTSGTTPTARRYTGQIEESGLGGLYFYNARWYEPGVGRFLQADTVVPDGDKASLIPLTVDFHERQFLMRLNAEHRFAVMHGFWPQLSAQEKRDAKVPRGPLNPQTLNRYSYAGNNAIRYTDPTGHETACNQDYLHCTGGRVVNNSATHSILIKGDFVDPSGKITKNAIFRLGPGQSSVDLGIVDVDEIYVDGASIDGYGSGYGTKVNDGQLIEVSDDGAGGLTVGRADWLPFGVGSQWYRYPYDASDLREENISTPSGGADLSQVKFIDDVFATGLVKVMPWLAKPMGWGDCSSQTCTAPPGN